MRRSVIIILSFLFILTGTAFAQFESKGNLSWEELVAISFDSQTRSLVGTIAIKLSGGYNGNHVVACWIDWDKNGTYGGNYPSFSNEFVGAATRYTPNPGAVPPYVYYGLHIPIAPPPGTLNGLYNVRCIMSWMQEITSSTMDPYYGNSLTGKIHIDAIY